MTRRTRTILSLAVVSIVILTLLFVNRSRLAAGAERMTAKLPVVSVTRAMRASVPFRLSSIGVLQASRDVPVIAETQGKVLSRYVDVGDVVRKGDPLVKVDTLLKYAAFIAAKTAFVKSENDLKRFTALHTQGNLSDNELELAALNARSVEAQYLVAKRQYEDALICAPVSGEIAERSVDAGMMVAPGMSVATIVNIAQLKVIVGVAESQISHVHKGMRVAVSVDAHAGRIYEGTVSHIAPKASESLLFPVEIVIANDPGHSLRAGMTAHIEFNHTATGEVLLVPRIALVGSARGGKIYVVENGIVHVRSITAGNEYGNDIEVLSGLREGDVVVTVGTNTIQDGVAVAVAP